MERLASAQDGGEGLKRDAGDVVLRLLGGQRLAGSLGMEAQLVGAAVGGAKGIAHFLGPDAAGGPELADLLEEVVVHVEEEAEARGEVVDAQPPLLGVANVLEPVCQGEGQFLYGVGAGLPDVVAADADGIPARHVAGAEFHGVGNQPHGGAGWEDVLVLGYVFFENVVLDSAANLVQRSSLLLGQRQVHGPDDGGGGVDGHGRGYLVQANAVEQSFHVGQRRHRDAAGAELTVGPRVVGVVPIEGGHIEGYREASLPLLQQELEPLVGFLGTPKPGEHTESPQAAPVAGIMDAAQVGELTGQAHRVHVALAGGIGGGVELLHR